MRNRLQPLQATGATTGPESRQPKPANLRRWLGWTRDRPTVAIDLDDDVARILCLRRQSVITACGQVSLPPGTVRNGRLRVTGPATDGLKRLRTDLHLPDHCHAVVLLQPRSVSVNGSTVRAGHTIGTVLPVAPRPDGQPGLVVSSTVELDAKLQIIGHFLGPTP